MPHFMFDSRSAITHRVIFANHGQGLSSVFLGASLNPLALVTQITPRKYLTDYVRLFFSFTSGPNQTR